MKHKDLKIQNSFGIINSKNPTFKKLLKDYSKTLLSVQNDLNNNQKTLSVLNQNYSFSKQLQNLKKFKKFKSIAIIGMGGSILGIEAIYDFFKNKIKKKVYFFDDINENKLIKFKKKKILPQTLFIIISKSGNTIETLSNLFSLNIIKKNAKNIIFISEKNSFLFKLSKKLNLFFIEHKEYVGGRYSILSEVGVVPSHIMGVNILKLRSKLQDFFLNTNKNLLKESTLKIAYFLQSNKFNNIVFLNYFPEFEKTLFWCQQLIAESLGKKGKGFFPVISNVPKDHHSLLQLYLDGPKDKIFYIFSNKEDSKLRVKIKKFINHKNSLDNQFLGKIKEAQKNALIKSFKKNKIQFREFTIFNKDEKTLGKFFSYFILETVMVGRLAKIDPFNQPAVEQVKVNTKILLDGKNQK